MTQRRAKIAIVGIGRQFSCGGKAGGEGFWRPRAGGRSGVADLSSSRWPAQGAARCASLTRHEAQQLYRVEFMPVRLESAPGSSETIVVGGTGGLAAALEVEALPELSDVLSRVAEGASPPKQLIVDATFTAATWRDVAQAAQEATSEALELVQRRLSTPELMGTELVWVTRGAVPADGAVTDLVHAPLWGLLRAARSEHPRQRLRLIDIGSDEFDATLLRRALASSAEPELALRERGALAPRLVRGGRQRPAWTSSASARARRPLLDVEGTVLVTGGTGQLGRALARHLVRVHGVRHLLLTSRRGLEAEGAWELLDSLQALGAEHVQVLACDVSVRSELVSALSRIPVEHPLTAVFHLAGVVDDGVIETQTVERLERVFSAKAAGAWHLHDLTRGRELSAFVLFSSTAGTLGAAGQSNNAAASTFLDALASHRQGGGAVAKSLAWGPWDLGASGMSAHMGESELSRPARQGVVPISVEHALRLLDAALDRPEVHLVPIGLQLPVLERRFEQDPAPLFRALIHPSPARFPTTK